MSRSRADIVADAVIRELQRLRREINEDDRLRKVQVAVELNLSGEVGDVRIWRESYSAERVR